MSLLSTLAFDSDVLAASGSTDVRHLERTCRSLTLYVKLGDHDGQVRACDELCKEMLSAASREERLLSARAILDQGVMPSLVVVLQTGRAEPCRATSALIAELCVHSEHKTFVVQSGALRPLIALLRRSSEPQLLREGARVLSALASKQSTVHALLREGAPLALKRLCHSKAVQAHALAVDALGTLARSDDKLLESDGLARIFCAVALDSVLEARAAAVSQMGMMLGTPSRRSLLLHAGVVKVLLRCCDVLNEGLKLSAIDGLLTLLTGAGLPSDAAGQANAPERSAQASLALEAKAAATLQFFSPELQGEAVLVGLTSDANPRVCELALKLVEYLSREAGPQQNAFEVAGLMPQLVRHIASAADAASGGKSGSGAGGRRRSRGGGGGEEARLVSPQQQQQQQNYPPQRQMAGQHTLEDVVRGVARGAKEGLDTLGQALQKLTVKAGMDAALLEQANYGGGRGAPSSPSKAGGGGGGGAILALTDATSGGGGGGGSTSASLPPQRVLLAARSLANMLASKTAQLALVAAGGVPALLSLAQAVATPSANAAASASSSPDSPMSSLQLPHHHSSSTDVRREAMRALSRLSSSPQHAKALSREGAMPVLLSTLHDAHHENDDKSLRYVACILGALTALPEVQLEIGSRQAVAEVVRLSRSRDSDTQRHAARAIGHLSRNSECQKQIGAAGGLRPLIKCGYSRSSELQQLVAQSLADLALDPDLNNVLEVEGAQQLLLTMTRSKTPEVAHWAHVARGNLEAASALGPLIRHCPEDNQVERVDMLTMSALVGKLRSGEARVSASVRRLTAAAVANLLVSPHNQRLLLECNGVKPLISLAHEALETDLQAQCMRAIANLAITPEYRPNLLQARVLTLIVGTLKEAQIADGATHTFTVLMHAARALGNMCAGGEVAAAIQQKAATEGALAVLLPLVKLVRDHYQDLKNAGVTNRLESVDDLLREITRALAKLAPLKSNQRPIVESEALSVVISMISSEDDLGLSVSVKHECLSLLHHLADVPDGLQQLITHDALPSLIALLRLPDEDVEAAAAELLARLATVREMQSRISADTIPQLVHLLHSDSTNAQLAALRALNELLFEHRPNQLAAMRAGVAPPCIGLASADDTTLNSNAATLICQIVLAEASDGSGGGGGLGGKKKNMGGGTMRLDSELRLRLLSAMAMSANAEAHAVAAMGLATMTNGHDANLPLMSKVALHPLVRLGGSPQPDTQTAALDALATLADDPDTQVDLVRIGALRMLLDRAATPGRDNGAPDLRSLALTVLQQLASNGANISVFHTNEIAQRLRGLAITLHDEPVVVRAVSAIERSIETISSLLELQGRQRPLSRGDVGAMSECVSLAGVDAAISREVGHTCAAIGGHRSNCELFVAEGGIELLNSLAMARSSAVQLEAAQAYVAFCKVKETHEALHKHGGLTSLVHLARSAQRIGGLYQPVALAFSLLAEHRCPKTWLVQSGAIPLLFAFIRNGDAASRFLAARALLYMR